MNKKEIKKITKTLFSAAIFTILTIASAHADLPRVALEISGGSAATDSRDFMLGYSFTVDSEFQIDGMGVWDEGSNGLTVDAEVGLWDSNGTLIIATTVTDSSGVEPSPHASGQWLIEDIKPLTLVPGSYTIGYLRPGGSDVWRFATPSTIANITYGNQMELATSTFQMPTSNTGNEGHFGPNMRVLSSLPDVTKPVPGLSGSGLALLVLLMLMVVGRRFYQSKRVS